MVVLKLSQKEIETEIMIQTVEAATVTVDLMRALTG